MKKIDISSLRLLIMMVQKSCLLGVNAKSMCIDINDIFLDFPTNFTWFKNGGKHYGNTTNRQKIQKIDG